MTLFGQFQKTFSNFILFETNESLVMTLISKTFDVYFSKRLTHTSELILEVKVIRVYIESENEMFSSVSL